MPSRKTWADWDLTSLSRGGRYGNRGASCPSRGRALLTLVEAFDDLTNVVLGLGLVGGGFDAVERVRGLDKNRVANNDLRVRPTGW